MNLARKYRPRKFSEVVGQAHVANTLRGAIARERVAHGYLLCGPRGTGKTTLARVLAMALNCPVRGRDAGSDPSEPCGECPSCTRIWSGSASLDVVEIDAASNRGVDDARDLRERAMYAPSGEARWKVYIIDEAHMLTREAWNALLKILEEPPPRVAFVFATTEPQKIAQSAAPVLSRLQRFDFRRIGGADLRARAASVLSAEGVEAESDALAMLARAADGSMRDALSLVDQVLALGGSQLTADAVRDALGLVAEDEHLAMLDLVIEHRAADVFGAVSRLLDLGVDLGVFLSGFADMVRALLAVTLNGDPGELSERARAALDTRKRRLTAGDLVRMLNALAELEPRFRRSTQQQLLLETVLVRFALLDRTVAIEELLRGLGNSGAPVPGSRAVGPANRETRPPIESARPRSDSSPAVPKLSDVAEPRGTRARYPTPAMPWTAVGASQLEEAPASTRPETAVAEPANEIHVADLNAIVGAWDDIVAAVRRERPFVATLLEGALPTGASASGLLTLQVDTPSVVDGLEAKKADLLAALRKSIAGLQRITIRSTESAAPASVSRMTVETVKSETLASLRKRDAVLAAAIDALDLEIVD